MIPRTATWFVVVTLVLSATGGCTRAPDSPAAVQVSGDEFTNSVTQLGGRTNVQVDLSGTGTTDEDLDRLVFPDRVTEINLSRTKVTDEGLVHLKKLRNLEKLNLGGTRVSDAGLLHLRELAQELPNLHLVELHNSLVSEPKQIELYKELIPRKTALKSAGAQRAAP